MNKEIRELFPERNVTLTLYTIDNSPEFLTDVKRPAVIICPGGGYSFLSDREGEPIALRYLAAGFHAAVLRYGIKEYAPAPGPLKDIAAAVAYLKSLSVERNIDSENIFVCGFSAGAHVAAQLGVFWDNGELLPEYKDNTEAVRPAGMILGYPVLDLHSSNSHLDIGIQPGADPAAVQFDQKHPKMPLDKMFIMDENEGRYFIDFEASMNAYIFDGEYTPKRRIFTVFRIRLLPLPRLHLYGITAMTDLFILQTRFFLQMHFSVAAYRMNFTYLTEAATEFLLLTTLPQTISINTASTPQSGWISPSNGSTRGVSLKKTY